MKPTIQVLFVTLLFSGCFMYGDEDYMEISDKDTMRSICEGETVPWDSARGKTRLYERPSEGIRMGVRGG